MFHERNAMRKLQIDVFKYVSKILLLRDSDSHMSPKYAATAYVCSIT